MKRLKDLLRLADYWIGVPLLWLGSIFAKKQPFPTEIQRIGIIKGTGMGDLVVASGALEDLRHAYPTAQIFLFAGPSAYPLAKLLASVDAVIPWPTNRPLRAISLLRQQRLDLLIDLGQWSRYEALTTALGGAAYSIGFRTPGQYRHYLYDATATHTANRHELENFRSLFRSIGMESTTPPQLRLKPEWSLDAIPDSARAAGSYALFHLWAIHPQREWPEERWREVARHLNAHGLAVGLTGSRSDQPRIRAFLETCQWGGAQVFDASSREMIDTLRWLRHSRLVISINTGILHVAAALNLPVIGLHGPTNSLRWGPVGSKAVSIQSSCPGSGFLNLGIEQTPENSLLPCMEAITTTEVIAAADSLLNSNPVTS